MILPSIIGFFPEVASSLFAGGSDVMMRSVSASAWLQIFLVTVFGFIIFLNKGKFKLSTYLFLFVIFLLWFMSGRVISFFAFPDGRLSSGWFYFETNREYICQNSMNCEKVFFYETDIEELPLWCVRITNKQTNSIIFIGPVIWSQALVLLHDNFPKSSQYVK